MAVSDRRDFSSQRISAIMFLVAAVAFLLTALVGDAGADTAFLVLAMVFVVLAVNFWRSNRTKTDESNR